MILRSCVLCRTQRMYLCIDHLQ